MEMDWIKASYDFGLPLRGVFVPSMWLRQGGFKVYDLFRDKLYLEQLFQLLMANDRMPKDAVLVRANLPETQDGLVLYAVSKEFTPVDEGCLIEIIHLRDLPTNGTGLPALVSNGSIPGD